MPPNTRKQAPKDVRRKRLKEDIEAIGGTWDSRKKGWRVPGKQKRAELNALYVKHGFSFVVKRGPQ